MTRRSSLAIVLAGAVIAAATVAIARAQGRQADEQAIRQEIDQTAERLIVRRL